MKSNDTGIDRNLITNVIPKIILAKHDESLLHNIYWNEVIPTAAKTALNITQIGAQFRGFNAFSLNKHKDYTSIGHFISETCMKNNIDCFMTAGSLLGSFRHHGMIPWDLDMDIVTRLKNKDVLINALQTEIKSGRPFRLKKKVSGNYKIATNSVYSDLAFVSENSTHLHTFVPVLLSTVFPTVLRPYGGYLIPAPRDTVACLRAFYGDDATEKCYLYKKKTTQTFKNTVKCRQLHPYLPFVKRTVNKYGHIVETLQIGQKAFYYIIL